MRQDLQNDSHFNNLRKIWLNYSLREPYEKFFFKLVDLYTIYIPKCAELNSKKFSEMMLVSLTLLKIVVGEKVIIKIK